MKYQNKNQWKQAGLLMFALLTLVVFHGFISKPTYQIAVLKYAGGGDWYANPSSLPNLIKFCNKELNTTIDPVVPNVEVGSEELFDYPFIHMTGHGNVIFSGNEVKNLRKYLLGGGFLHIDDNYGMDEFIRPQIKKIFPEYELVEVPFSHDLYTKPYSFPKGLPKIHEHDNNAPQGLAIVHKGKVVLFYTYECDLGDGWEDSDVHNDSEASRVKALKMGGNIISYAFLN